MLSWLQGRASPGEGPGPGDQRQSSRAGDQPAAGPDPPAAVWGGSGAGSGQRPPTHQHGKKSLEFIPKDRLCHLNIYPECFLCMCTKDYVCFCFF